jgi:hypothetical protein
MNRAFPHGLWGGFNSVMLGTNHGKCVSLIGFPAEFNQHQRNAFCVFSGSGVTGLRRYLNLEAKSRQMLAEYETDDATEAEANESDNDQTMTGLMSAARIGGEDVDADAELEEGALTATNTPIPMDPVPQPN